MKKIQMKILAILIFGFLGYHAIYIKKLSEISLQNVQKTNFDSYADSLYHQSIMKEDSIISLSLLMEQYNQNVDSAFARHGNRLGIGNSAYFMVRDAGKIIEKTSEGFSILSDQGTYLHLETKFLFGNAIRDASKKVKMTDFKNNKEFNRLSESLNTLIREKILPSQTEHLKVGDQVIFTGALKLSKKTNLQLIIYPIEIKQSSLN